MLTLTITPSPRVVMLHRGFTDVLKLLAAIMIAMAHYSSHALDYVENPIYKYIYEYI